MDKLYLIDGFGGSPEQSWINNISNHFSNQFDIRKVNITSPKTANVLKWDNDLKRQIIDVQHAYFICHSLGCISLLRYLSEYCSLPKGVIFVSPFNETVVNYPEFEDFICSSTINLSLLDKNSFVIASKNDAIIPAEISQKFSSEINLPFLLLPKGNHFRAADGVLKMNIIEEYISQYW